jgi:hypothetical protein
MTVRPDEGQVAARRERTERRLRRLAEELVDEGFAGVDTSTWSPGLLAELDYALHPAVHERRVPSYGAFVGPAVPPPAWEGPSQLSVTRREVTSESLPQARRFADGISSWLVRRGESRFHWAGLSAGGGPVAGSVLGDDGDDAGPIEAELVVFDRPAGSERDLVVLAEASGAALVQRHPSGTVRVVGPFGVLRWDGLGWHHEPPLSSWIDVDDGTTPTDHPVLATLLEFAVHDLGARGTGAILVYRPEDGGGRFDVRLPEPPALQVCRPADLAPLRHVLAQVDGAAVFDASGTLRQLGVRLVPSSSAESDLRPFRGMRHTAGRYYSYDDPSATVIVVSEDGPVTVLRRGQLLGRSEPL